VKREWKLPPERPSTYPTPEDLQARRAGIAGLTPVARAERVKVDNATYGSVPCVVCTPAGASATVLYFHGGGYRLGSPTNSTPFATRLADATGARVVMPAYRLAPEHPFPAALHDAAAVYGALLDEASGGADGVITAGNSTAGVIAAGDSAGGGLAAALTMACIASGILVPRALVLLSPWVDLTCTGDTFVTRPGDQLFPLASAQQASAMYLQGHDAADPLVSPVLGDVSGFPPTLVFASVDETLLADSVSMIGKLAGAGIAVTASLQADRMHAWPAIVPDHPASKAALVTVGAFVSALGT
jgi:epsilon-lactone hydrolase